MNWMLYATVASLALASADLCVKLAAGRLSNSLGLLLYGSCTFATGLGWTLWQRLQGAPFRAEPIGLAAGLGVGMSFSIVVVGLYLAFSAGAPVSIVSPVVRLGGLLVAGAVGIAAFSEPLTARYAAGLALTIGGIYLILTR